MEGFKLFLQEKKEKVMEENPSFTPIKVVLELMEIWKKLNKVERKSYEEKLIKSPKLSSSKKTKKNELILI